MHAQMRPGERVQRLPIHAIDCNVAPQLSDTWLQLRPALLQAPSQPDDQPIPAVALALAHRARASARSRSAWHSALLYRLSAVAASSLNLTGSAPTRGLAFPINPAPPIRRTSFFGHCSQTGTRLLAQHRTRLAGKRPRAAMTRGISEVLNAAARSISEALLRTAALKLCLNCPSTLDAIPACLT